MPAIRRHIVRALLVCPVAISFAEGASAPPDSAGTSTLQQVEVTGTSTDADGRDATASRVIISRDEITRHGDNSVADVLRRMPGITVIGGQGRASEIRMRGLGNGYTQVLINGESMPGGFSLDSLSPNQIERIELARVASVDIGAQAIAGTINIILRQSIRKAQREVTAAVSSRSGRGSAQLDGQFSDRLNRFSYSLGAGLARKNETWSTRLFQDGTDAAGHPDLHRITQRRAYGLVDSISLTPKLTPHWGEQDKVSMEAVLRHNRFNDHSDDQRATALGPTPRYTSDTQKLDLRTSLAQGRLNWTHTLSGGGTLEARLGTNMLRRASDTRFQGRDEAGDLAMLERVTSSTTEGGLLATGKLRLPYTDGHAVAMGWDGDRTTRQEGRSQRQSSPVGRPVLDLDENYKTTVQRLAIFAQDEWDLDESLSAYAGVRWAALRTTTEGQGMAPAGNHSAVLSPVLQVLWKPRGIPGDQIRFALSRTYKAPRAVDLIPRRFVAVDNSPTTPNLQGNPGLRPELAWGIDLAFEHSLPRKIGFMNVSASARRIQDVILDQLFLDNGAWVSTKTNTGSARVFGLEIESRASLRAVWVNFPDIDVRANLSRNWSSVDQVPGPDNRLDSQIPLSANLGLDWRLSPLPLTAGMNLAYRGATRTQTSSTLTTASNAVNTLDLYVLWKLTPQTQLRMSIANVLQASDISTDTYGDASGRFVQVTDAPTVQTFRLGLELKL